METEIANIWLTVFAGLGGLTGVVGLWLAARANRTAKTAQEAAEEANRLSATSNDIAGEANEIAREANAISRDASDAAARSIAIQTEHHDVDWEYAFPRPGILRITNVGTSSAHEVRARAVVDGREREVTNSTVGPSEHLELDYRSLHAELRRERLAEERRARQGSFPTLPSPMAGHAYGYARVVWRTSMGVTRESEFRLVATDLED